MKQSITIEGKDIEQVDIETDKMFTCYLTHIFLKEDNTFIPTVKGVCGAYHMLYRYPNKHTAIYIRNGW